MIAPLFFILLAGIFCSPVENLNMISSAVKNWKELEKVTLIDSELARESSFVFSNLKRIDSINSTLNVLRVSCEIDVEPVGKAAIGATAQALARLQDLFSKTFQMRLRAYAFSRAREKARVNILSSYRDSGGGSCNIPGNFKWSQSSVKAVVKIKMQNGGACIYGGKQKKSWTYCHSEVIRHET